MIDASHSEQKQPPWLGSKQEKESDFVKSFC